MSAALEIEARLTAPDGPFATHCEDVLGERMQVLRDRAPSLRALLAEPAERGAAE